MGKAVIKVEVEKCCAADSFIRKASAWCFILFLHLHELYRKNRKSRPDVVYA